MKKKSGFRRNMGFISFLCCLSYFVSYLTRLNYAACLVEIQRELQISKSQASLPVTGSFLTYGAGQLICGFLGDRIRPHRMIFTGLLGTAVCNILLSFSSRIDIILLIWCVNGFFQSMLWPPLVRIMAEALDGAWYRRCCVLVSLAASVSAVAVYLFAPVCFSFMGWQSAFRIPALIGGATALFWICNMRGTVYEKADTRDTGYRVEKKDYGSASLFHEVPLLPVLAAIVLMGILRDGITTWMPAYMMDCFGVNTGNSVLVTAVIPLFSIFSTLLASALCTRIGDELRTSLLLFVVSLSSCGLMFFAHNRYSAGCVVLMMIITGCMHGINLMLISRLPRYFAGFGMVSTLSGVLNAFTYVGSSLSTYSFGAVADKSGWLSVIGIWFAVSVGGVLLLLCCMGKWKCFRVHFGL